ncbi:MAG TPA: glycoside hydrolase family 16 protein, partial [Flavisolibacter sp.]|nr:glycoside hydrolase family 16 protein [Flavisolibacter sp.]
MNVRFACRKFAFGLLALSIFSSCEKQIQSSPQLVANGKPVPSTPAVAPTICDYSLDEAALQATGWTKIFDENFDTNLSNWTIWTGGAYTNELQYYQAANLQVVDGNLVITATKETVSGATTPSDPTLKTFNYTSGRIECKSNVSANSTTPKVRMVARIKLPTGYGMWPAFWSYGDPWPTQGEIDFLEARGQEPTKYQTNYFYGKTANRNLVRGQEGFITADADLTACYHVYEMVWEQNTLTSYLDGKVVEVKSGGYIP